MSTQVHVAVVYQDLQEVGMTQGAAILSRWKEVGMTQGAAILSRWRMVLQCMVDLSKLQVYVCSCSSNGNTGGGCRVRWLQRQDGETSSVVAFVF